MEELVKFKDGLTDKQRRVVGKYASQTKLNAVARWKYRMMRARIKQQILADAVDIAQSRISEYIQFKKEPREEMFLRIESEIYNLEKR